MQNGSEFQPLNQAPQNTASEIPMNLSQKITSIFTHLTLKERYLLSELAQMLPSNAIVVEIGSYLGASTCFLAFGLSLKNGVVYAVDTWTNIGMSEGTRDTYQEFLSNTASMQRWIRPLRGYSETIAKDFSEKIDLLFIDGDHSYEGVSTDLRVWLPKMKNAGIIAFHDYSWAEGVRRVVEEFVAPIQLQPGAIIDSIYWTRIDDKAWQTASRVNGADQALHTELSRQRESMFTAEGLQGTYNKAFFDHHTEEKIRSAGLVAPLILEVFPIQSLVDVGCGNGVWLSMFQKHGILNLSGYDASALVPEDYLVDQKIITSGCDFTSDSFVIDQQVDLAMSLEVAEHLPASAAEKFVSILVQAAPIVIFSAAYPGQTGVDHFNEQPPWYWREKFERRGYVEIDFLRPQLWSNQNVNWWYRQNITAFVKRDYLDNYPKAKALYQKYKNLPDPQRLTLVSERLLKNQLEGKVIRISVIVPTRNRANYLHPTLKSLLQQNLPPTDYEVIVVDNDSKDQTCQVVADVNQINGNRVRYITEPIPGLLSGRHRGATEARGEILVYCDDDIEVSPNWLSAILEGFRYPDVHLVGGPSLPKFESPPPDWIIPYCIIKDSRITCSALSLIDLGDQVQEINPRYIWGLNFAIRKKTLFEVEGFHPDGTPQHLLHFRGDGETGLSDKLKAQGYKALYHPQAKVYHHIPSNRLTIEYFRQRFFRQGISDSYTEIRKRGTINGIPERIFNLNDAAIPNQPPFNEDHLQIRRAYIDGYNFHLDAVRQSPRLLQWVLKENYFNYRLPALEEGFSPPETSEANNGSQILHELVQLGICQYSQRNLNEAAEFFLKALKLAPQDADVNVCLGRVYFDMQRYEDALHYLQKAIEVNQNDADAWSGIAEIAKQLGDRTTWQAAHRLAHQLSRDSSSAQPLSLERRRSVANKQG